MLRFLYYLLTFPLSIVLGVLFLVRARGRARLWERFGVWGDLRGEYVWFHGASVGEVNGILPLIREWKALHPHDQILLTSTSVTGLERGASDVDVVRLLPFDSWIWLFLATRKLSVSRIFFGETELWPGFLTLFNRRGVPLHLVNGIVNESTFRTYSLFRWFLAPYLQRLDSVSASDEASCERFLQLGAPSERLRRTGNAKLDSVGGGSETGDLLQELFVQSRPVVVFGSVHPDEFPFFRPVFEAIARNELDIHCVLAPRHSEKFDFFEKQLRELGCPFAKRSEGQQTEFQVVLLDSLGELSRAYSGAAFATVGGTFFPLGGHNPLEPAAYGVPVAIGPHYQKIQSQVALLRESEALFEVTSAEGVLALVRKLLTDPTLFGEKGRAAHRVNSELQGASKRILEWSRECEDKLPKQPVFSLLDLLSLPYGAITKIRNLMFDIGFLRVFESSLPVICVGNLTAGGNGKTPLCEYLVRVLSERGFSPVVLSRGYGGYESGPYQVQPDDSAVKVGDEPKMMLAKLGVPVVVARSRVEGAKLIEQQGLGDVIVLDDGYQHRYLSRDFNIVTVDVSTERARRTFVAGKLLPVGRFRESLNEGLKRADIVVFAHRRTRPDQPLPKYLYDIVPKGIPVFESSMEVSCVRSLGGSRLLEPQPIVAACAIAQPEAFFQTLQAKGFEIADRCVLPDHVPFSPAARRELKMTGLPIVFTEKDCAKFPTEHDSQMHVVEVSLRISCAEEFFTALQVPLRQCS